MATNVYTYTGIEKIPRNARYIKVEPGVTVIPPQAFKGTNLVEVSLPEGLTEIGDEAFSGCCCLSKVNLPEGLVEIGDEAFSSCRFESIKFPSTLKRIGKEAFRSSGLKRIDLPEGLEIIGERAFGSCSLSYARIPSCVTKIKDSIFGDLCVYTGPFGHMVSLELSENVHEVDIDGLELGRLRNVALPHDVTISGTVRNGNNVFRKYYNEEIEAFEEMKHRFDGLPIHKLCYYHTYDNDTYEKVENIILGEGKRLRSGKRMRVDQVNQSGNKQDPMGFTPLHILVCSAWHNQPLHELIIEHYPDTLITKDKWNATPLLYAFWTGAPSIEFLLESQYELFPDVPVDWGIIFRQLMHYAPTRDPLMRALCVYRDLSPEKQNMKWESFLHKEAEAVGMHEADHLGLIVAFVAYGRLDCINSKKWENQIMSIVSEIREESGECCENFQEEVKTIFSMLDIYENIKEGTSLLELALWKAKINSAVTDGSISSTDFRTNCRIHCYADIVIPNVLPFLSPMVSCRWDNVEHKWC